MPLVFLGVPSPALPLPVWILGAIALGAATTFVITALFGLARLTARRSERKTVRQATPTNSYAYAETPRETRSSSNDDDWFGGDDDDWTSEPKDKPKRDFEARQAPTSETRSGSTYSYTYREAPEPKQPDVVDADYRVIRPPVRKLDEDE